MLIVGGGPAGLSVASRLGSQISSIVVHQDAKIGEPVRTSGGTWLRDMQALEIPSQLYQVIDQLDFFADQAEARFRVEQDKMAVMDVTGVYQYLAGLSDDLDRKLLLGAKFLTTQKTQQGYLSKIRSRSLGEIEIESRFIVDASGWHTAVLSDQGLAQPPARTGVGIEYEFARGDYPKNRAILFVGDWALTGYGWVFPTTNGTVRLGVGVIRPDTDLTPKQVMDAFIAGGHAARFGLTVPESYVVNAGSIPSVDYDPKLVFGTIIRTGDAANFATPTVGEGIRIAIEYGRLLGVELTAFVNGDPRALARYEAACAKAFERDYRFGLMMNKRIARYDAARWSKSVARLSRLTELEMTALVRSRFGWRTILRTLWLAVLGKLRR